MSLQVTLLLHLVSGIVLRYNLCRSRGVHRMHFRALLVLNVLQLAFNPIILASFEGSDAPWTLFVGYPVLALVLGVTALVKYVYANHLTRPLLPLTRRLLITTTSISDTPRLTRRRSGLYAFSPRRQRSVHKGSGVESAMHVLLLSALGYLGRTALVIFREAVTSTWIAVKWLVPLASGLLATVVRILNETAVSSAHAANRLVEILCDHTPSLGFRLFGKEARSTPPPSLDGVPACFPLDAVVSYSRFYDKWVLLAMSYRLQFGVWIAIERVWYRPSTGTMTETWLILVNHMGFEYDLNNIYSSTSGQTA